MWRTTCSSVSWSRRARSSTDGSASSTCPAAQPRVPGHRRRRARVRRERLPPPRTTAGSGREAEVLDRLPVAGPDLVPPHAGRPRRRGGRPRARGADWRAQPGRAQPPDRRFSLTLARRGGTCARRAARRCARRSARRAPLRGPGGVAGGAPPRPGDQARAQRREPRPHPEGSALRRAVRALDELIADARRRPAGPRRRPLGQLPRGRAGRAAGRGSADRLGARDRGDPAEDVGAFLGDYLRRGWRRSPERLAPASRAYTLGRMTPALAASGTPTPRSGAGRRPGRAATLRRAVPFAGARL